MALREELQAQGNWLFHWRSFLPFLILMPLISFELYWSKGEPLFPAFETAWEWICIGISLLGLMIRAYSVGCVPKGTSGRNTKEQRADELNTSGIYSIVRNPLYAGNFVMCLGLVLYPMSSLYLVLLYLLIFLLYHERIIFAEEEYLREKFGSPYLEWAAKTPFLIPKFRQWTQPILRFSWKHAIKREDSSFFALLVIYFILHVLKNYFKTGILMPEPFWLPILGGGFLLYSIIRFLRKKTKFLDVQGR